MITLFPKKKLSSFEREDVFMVMTQKLDTKVIKPNITNKINNKIAFVNQSKGSPL